MAPVKAPQSKARSRKGGSAIPLDDTDKRLMNLLQSDFRLVPEPFAPIAAEAGITVDDALERTQRLLDGRIIREITPIFDTRALGFDSMLVAAKVDAENPHRAAKIINSHPGVSHNYLRTHEFNLWFTIATPPDSKLGLQGSLDVLQELTGAESIRQLPTLKLFKINMNLEMEKGTDALSAVADAATPRELDRQPYDDFDIAVIRALQGPMEAVERPYDAAAAEVGVPIDDFLAHLEGMVERKIAPSRRGHPLPPPRRLLGERDGRLEGAGRADPRGRHADGVGARNLPLLRAADVRGLAVLGVHDGPRPLEGGVRRGPPGDRGRARPPRRRPRDPLLLDRVQEDPPALLHGRVRGLGTRARGCLTPGVRHRLSSPGPMPGTALDAGPCRGPCSFHKACLTPVPVL